jgi:hypothetical protein
MKIILYSIIIFISFTSCKEIIATDITDTLPTLILPKENDTLQINPVHFKWEETTGATKYHLQIVSPSFSNIEKYAIDSMVVGTSIFLSLDSNEYEMKLTAINAGYKSKTLGPIKFWVGVQSTQSSNTVVLTSPANSTYFNENFNGTFSWQSLQNVSSYEFSIRKGTSYASSNIIETQAGIVTNQYNLVASLDEGEYHWGVKAYFSNGIETIVSSRKFYIDTTHPNVPTIVSPSGSVTPGEITFTWTNGTDLGNIQSPIKSIIQVAENQEFTLGLIEDEVLGQSTTITVQGSGTRYWRVKNTDEAGNVSSFSSVAEFTLF